MSPRVVIMKGSDGATVTRKRKPPEQWVKSPPATMSCYTIDEGWVENTEVIVIQQISNYVDENHIHVHLSEVVTALGLTNMLLKYPTLDDAHSALLDKKSEARGDLFSKYI